MRNSGIRNINYQDTLDSDNSQKLGILSIKSHFPSFFIQNLVSDELSIQTLSEDDKNKYYTNIEHSDYKIFFETSFGIFRLLLNAF